MCGWWEQIKADNANRQTQTSERASVLVWGSAARANNNKNRQKNVVFKRENNETQPSNEQTTEKKKKTKKLYDGWLCRGNNTITIQTTNYHMISFISVKWCIVLRVFRCEVQNAFGFGWLRPRFELDISATDTQKPIRQIHTSRRLCVWVLKMCVWFKRTKMPRFKSKKKTREKTHLSIFSWKQIKCSVQWSGETETVRVYWNIFLLWRKAITNERRRQNERCVGYEQQKS